MNLRFAAVISHPNQHHSPLFGELNKVPGVRVKAFYGSDFGVRPSFDAGFNQTFAWDVPLLEGHEHEFLSHDLPAGGREFFRIDSARLGERLAEFSPHAVWVHGYGFRLSWRALRWARGRSAVIYFGDSELLHHRPWLVRLAKSAVVRWFFRRCDAFLTIGDNNEAYYAHYGVPASKMVRGAYPVDVRRFQAALNEPGRPTRAEMRRRFGLPEDAVVALFLAKMIPIKRPGDLLEAVGLLRARGVRVHALFVGDGVLRPALERRARELGVQGEARFAGFVNQRDMPLTLDCGDILAMTSEKDPHPLAVTESMIAGNAVVASDRVGCVGKTDTVRPGVNGLVYPCGRVEALADALGRLAADGELRRRMGEESRRLAPTQDVSVTVGAVLRALLRLRPRFRERWRDVPESVFETIRQQALGLPVPEGAAVLQEN
jgi:glycosyltransferase involved in cell wall biosynthesis